MESDCTRKRTNSRFVGNRLVGTHRWRTWDGLKFCCVCPAGCVIFQSDPDPPRTSGCSSGQQLSYQASSHVPRDASKDKINQKARQANHLLEVLGYHTCKIGNQRNGTSKTSSPLDHRCFAGIWRAPPAEWRIACWAHNTKKGPWIEMGYEASLNPPSNCYLKASSKTTQSWGFAWETHTPEASNTTN